MAESKQSGAAADLERPMPFIEWSDDDDEFHVNEDAVAYLSSLSGHVAVVAVAGKYRTGKSYLLNLLADQPTAFEVGARGAGGGGPALPAAAALPCAR